MTTKSQFFLKQVSTAPKIGPNSPNKEVGRMRNSRTFQIEIKHNHWLLKIQQIPVLTILPQF